ncbi:MAG: methylmalonyl-CoA epimerase [Candidatus Dormibacteria bacterium]
MAADPSPVALDHVGLAVANLDGAVARYQRVLGVSPSHRELLPHDGVAAVFFDLGASSLELLGNTRDDSALASFLERRGEGLHHIAYRVRDLEAELARWREMGAELIDQHGRSGARGRLVAFVHPRAAGGVLTELCQLTQGEL